MDDNREIVLIDPIDVDDVFRGTVKSDIDSIQLEIKLCETKLKEYSDKHFLQKTFSNNFEHLAHIIEMQNQNIVSLHGIIHTLFTLSANNASKTNDILQKVCQSAENSLEVATYIDQVSVCLNDHSTSLEKMDLKLDEYIAETHKNVEGLKIDLTTIQLDLATLKNQMLKAIWGGVCAIVIALALSLFNLR